MMKPLVHLSLIAILSLSLTGLALVMPKAAPVVPAKVTIGANLRANPDDPAQVARGRQLHLVHCALCHGAQLQGQFGWRVRGADGRMKAPPQDPTGHLHEHADGLIVTMTLIGDQIGIDMPRFKGVLSEAQVVDILAYIKSTWPLAVRIAQAAANPDKAGMPLAVSRPDLAVAETCLATAKTRSGRPNQQ